MVGCGPDERLGRGTGGVRIRPRSSARTTSACSRAGGAAAADDQMIHEVEVKTIPLDDYAAVAHLSRSVAELRVQASALAPALAGRTVWMLNSTARGGGVAEMMPREVAMLRELGVDTRWAVIEPADPEFFPLTKRLHNLIHGS